MEKNNNEEFIKIDNNNLYIDKKTISSLIFKANNFFDSFENFAKIVNKKLDYLIESKSQKDNGINIRPTFFFKSKEKQPKDRKSQHNSKKSENINTSESSTPFYEENEK